MEAYQRAISLKPTLQRIGSDRVKPRSIHALAIAYYDSAAFALKPNTQGVYRNIIERFCRETDGDGSPNGDKSAATMKAHNVEQLMEARSAKPDSANGLRKVLHRGFQVDLLMSALGQKQTLGMSA